MKDKRALLIGDYSSAKWHPLTGVDEQIVRILEEYKITICDNWPALTLSDMQEYPLVINYIDAWAKRGNIDFAGELIAYVALGGSLLTIHNGIIGDIPEAQQMMGGVFTGHPAQCDLTFSYQGSHPVIKGLESFTIFEEPYRFTMAELAKVQVILTYEYEGETWPAAWVRLFGKGKAYFLAPGHTKESFDNEGYQILIRRCADNLTDQN